MQDVSAIKGEDAGPGLQLALGTGEQGFPAGEQNLVLWEGEKASGAQKWPTCLPRWPALLAPAHAILAQAQAHPEVDDGHGHPVRASHDAVKVLQARGQEGAEGAAQPHSARLLEALEVGSADAPKATGLWAVECHQVQLRGQEQPQPSPQMHPQT